jgi:hypothetical protein
MNQEKLYGLLRDNGCYILSFTDLPQSHCWAISYKINEKLFEISWTDSESLLSLLDEKSGEVIESRSIELFDEDKALRVCEYWLINRNKNI